jgi:hypothetical protein
MVLASTYHVTKMNTKRSLVGKVRLARKADNLTAI